MASPPPSPWADGVALLGTDSAPSSGGPSAARDRVLIEVAAALASSVRAQDTLARQGGDEFSILAPETDDQQAALLARRVQDAIAIATANSLTTSVGWVTFPTDAEDAATLLALADADLRRAKSAREPETAAHAGILQVVEQDAG